MVSMAYENNNQHTRQVRIGVLALQGDFAEHEQMLERLGASCTSIRCKKDLEADFDGIVIPGGESTVIGKLLRQTEIFDGLKRMIDEGMPVFGTCAGLIILAKRLSNDENTHLATLPVTVRRNAYGRQLGSFQAVEEVSGVGKIPMTFIRAPYIEDAEEGVEILARAGGNIVAVRYRNQLAISFHPEVTECTKMHEYFMDMCREHKSGA